ncbi:carbohydrate binding family 9 domain-containing protein [Arthrospiribacter ruber]|uniref:Carbohydrate family 9 binding domain-like n=1 Tax=Arthrospiribacter ruber TaxID=2487934 RepID=A0A951J5R3_9BACT|nr:carbohydrate binding family 9 domain-containing protein [Arthrospiribacter ruber]MBW3470273.1 hypothetical protein [Arthrospiribacter ruber]
MTKRILLIINFFSIVISAQGQATFTPPVVKMTVSGIKASNPIRIDGDLDEEDWINASIIKGFTQREPNQSEPASFDTEVKILYDDQFLYIGATCFDDLSNKSNLRVLNMQRDFDPYQNDKFGVAIDGFLDGQNSNGFEVTPYGAQRDLQVIDGEEWRANQDWDGLWFVRTKIHEDKWTAEIAIPWKTLRYKKETDELLISFTRNIRRKNEINTYPKVPRAFSHFRMAYAAKLVDIVLPPPSTNVQINPYWIATQNKDSNLESSDYQLQLGGEFKWAPNPNMVLDGTINTDFAQADVDQQVQNLTRFNVLFPERRQFFLENANIFKPSISSFIQPFFSRRIGLDDDGNPIPLDGGLRLTSQTKKQTYGLLAMRQRATATSPLSHFIVGRYVQNFSDQSRAGLMISHREDDPLNNATVTYQRRGNTTATFNTFIRPSQTTNIEVMASTTMDSETGKGLAVHTYLSQLKNWGYIGFIGQYVSENYNPRTGFLALDNYILLSPAFSLDLRPAFLPDFIRSFAPSAGVNGYWTASDRQFLQSLMNFTPLNLRFENGGNVEFKYKPEIHELFDPFVPLGIAIAPGYYSFSRFEYAFNSDISRKISGQFRFEHGDYFDGSLNVYNLNLRISPFPYWEFNSTYIFNQIRGLGNEQKDLNAQLLVIGSRLAANPRLQLITNYQFNNVASNIWNVRFAWEYRPLSFIYFVFNSNTRDDLLTDTRFNRQESIAKFTFLKQF